jgi:hypothetical protein
MRHSPDTRRTLAVAPLIRDKRCYGECPASVRRGYGGVSKPPQGIEFYAKHVDNQRKSFSRFDMLWKAA